jgi:hypothetical protein
MRANGINGPVRKAAVAGLMTLLCGAVPWAYAQPRAHVVHSTTIHHSTTVHHAATFHHATYVRVGNVGGRAVYEHRTTHGRRTVYARRTAVRAGRPAYARVHVNVNVNQVFPAPGPAYPGYTAGFEGYAPYPYAYWMYPSVWCCVDLTAKGYHDGFHRGQDDAEDHRPFDPFRKGNRNPGSASYNSGFMSGYAAGYGN